MKRKFLKKGEREREEREKVVKRPFSGREGREKREENYRERGRE